jgi:glycosyltransferase involved in cell wall biosynthesis
MRVVNANKFYYHKGGAETAYFQTARLLEEHGHEVVPFAMRHPENEPTPWSRFFPSQVEFRAPGGPASRLKRAARVIWSGEARDRMRDLLNEARPDLVHLHNIAHQLSPSILEPVKDAGLPAVQSLHDYKLTCPTYLHRTPAGEICERCKGGHYAQCVIHRCNAGSVSMSLVNAVEATWHRARHSYDAVDLFLCPSAFQYAKCLEFGVPAERLALVPHFVYASDFAPRFEAGDHALFAGRLSSEKGVGTLLEAVALVAGLRLLLAGEGPDRATLEARAQELGIQDRVRFAGYLRGADYESAWREAAYLVLPSECYEVRPMVIHEAYARGKPVVATRIGSIPEIVSEGVTGLLVKPGDARALAAGLQEMAEEPQRRIEMGRAARTLVERELGPDRHWQALRAAYDRVLEKRGGRAA